MALQGMYTWKGIELSDAYLQITNFTYALHSQFETSVKTPAVMEEDGVTIKTEAVYESKWVKKPFSECVVKVFKDKSARDADPNGHVSDFRFNLELKLTASAKNPIKQAYEALKVVDKYKDYTDV
tara:strand:+ start:270 stop:644 length:375 start_codon:yes stop_codon:yes gene_type:complete